MDDTRYNSLTDKHVIPPIRSLSVERGKGKKTEISYPHFQHVVLDGSDDDEDEESAERNFSENSFGIPVDALHHAVVDGRVEEVILRQNKLESSNRKLVNI